MMTERMDSGAKEVENMIDKSKEMEENVKADLPTYPVKPDELPEWFGVGCVNDLIFEDAKALSLYLNSHRQDVYTALRLYQTHDRSIITVMLTFSTAITAIFSFAAKESDSNSDLLKSVEIMGGTLLILLFLTACISHIILKKYYQVYVSALLQATQVHYWAKVPGFGRYEQVIWQLAGKYRNLGKTEYINERTWTRDSNLLYVIVVWTIGILGLVGGLYLLVFAPISG